MQNKGVLYGMVTAHVVDSAMPDIQAWAEAHGATVEDMAQLLAPILAHQFDHAFDAGAGTLGVGDQDYADAEKALTEMVERETGVDLGSPDVKELIKQLENGEFEDVDALCKAAGLC